MIPEELELTTWNGWARGRRRRVTFAELLELMIDRSREPHDKDAGWSPGTFRGDYRTLANAERLFAIGLDVDKGEHAPRSLAATFATCAGFVHSTRRHTAATPRSRIVLMYGGRSVTLEEHRRIWTFLEEETRKLGIALDPSTRDPSRFWFWPCVPVTGDELGAFHVLDGAPLDPDALLAAARPKPSPSTSSPAFSGRWCGDLNGRAARAIAYVERMPVAVSGAHGHTSLWRAAVACVRGFELPTAAAREIVRDYSARCLPPWSEREIDHKLDQAARAADPRWFPGYLLREDRR